MANHPFGGLEGVILGAILTRLRPDVKCLGNSLLQQVVALRDWVIPVNPFGRKRCAGANARALREAIRWVRAGGALVTFPAGEVSHLLWSQSAVTDVAWSPHIGAIVRHAKGTVLPVYFPGRNSALFQGVGLVHPRLRTLLLPHELINKRSQTIAVVIGRSLPWSKLARCATDAVLITHLRLATYGLDPRGRQPRSPLPVFIRRTMRQTAVQQPIMPAPPPSRLAEEVAALSAAQRLVDHGEFVVYLAQAAQIPAVLQEIGRLREVTFRAIGEGTGKTVDRDPFDAYYQHLFVWNTVTREVVGAYRLGLTDVILQQYGPRGLYTSTLFRFKPAFFERLQHAIELGRAFVRTEYQRQHGCLWLLWRGIAAFLVRQRQYIHLFGPVSISQDYHPVSRNVMVQFLRDRLLDPELAPYVHPRSPYRGPRVTAVDVQSLCASLHNIENVSLLIADIEDGKGVPVLLRYYVKLGATVLGVNVDKNFSNVIDGLILVNVTKTDPQVLRRLMGPDGFASFAGAHHNVPHRALAADAACVPPA